MVYSSCYHLRAIKNAFTTLLRVVNYVCFIFKYLACDGNKSTKLQIPHLTPSLPSGPVLPHSAP